MILAGSIRFRARRMTMRLISCIDQRIMFGAV